MAITEPHGGEGSAVCARGGDTSSRRWLQSWPRFSTTAPHGDRGRPGTGRGARDELHGHAPEDAPPRAAGTQYFAMDVDDVPAAGGSRPDRLPDVSGPQERVQRRTVQQIVDYPSLPILDDPEPLMVGQVIEVPKIQRSSCWSYRRFVDSLRQPQTVEQLVEVPTTVSFPMIAFYRAVMAQRTVEQNVDIPAVGVSGTGGGLSGFLPGQSYSMTAEQIVDNPVPRRGFDEGLQGFPTGQSSATSSEQTVDIPVPHTGRHDLSPSSVDFSNPPDTANQRVFRNFPRLKKSAKIPRTQGSGTGCALELMDAVSLAGVSSVATWRAASSPCCCEARVVLPGLLVWSTLLPSHALQVPAVLSDLQWKVPQIPFIDRVLCWTTQFLVGRLHARVVHMTGPGSDSEENCGSAVAFL